MLLTLLDAFIAGLTYAGFSAFVLEATDKGAAATRHSLFASRSNTPIAYTTATNGWAYFQHRGSAGMLYSEVSASVMGLVVFLLALALFRRCLGL